MTSYGASIYVKSWAIVEKRLYMTFWFSRKSMKLIFSVSLNIIEHFFGNTSDCCSYYSFEMRYVGDRGHKTFIIYESSRKDASRSCIKRSTGPFLCTISPNPANWKHIIQKRTNLMRCVRMRLVLLKSTLCGNSSATAWTYWLSNWKWCLSVPFRWKKAWTDAPSACIAR